MAKKRKQEKKPTWWRATFVGEVGDPATGAAEVDGVFYPKGKAVAVSPATKERLEKIDYMEFSFEEVDYGY